MKKDGNDHTLYDIEHNHPFFQQELRSCRPNFNSYPTTYLIAFSTLHLALAIFLSFLSNGWHNIKIRYDHVCPDYVECILQFEIDRTLEGPVHVYYELSNFTQGHFRFRQSVDYRQLYGEYITETDRCYPLDKYPGSSEILAPCGLKAFYAWRDYYSFPSNWNISKSPLTWQHEIGSLFRPLNKNYQPKQRWLGSILGFENETVSDNFAIWMRTAPAPKFRKLFAKIENQIPKGKYNVTITTNYPTAWYNGKRYLVFVKNSHAGGRNLTLIGINSLICFIYMLAALITSIIDNKISIRALRNTRRHKKKRWVPKPGT